MCDQTVPGTVLSWPVRFSPPPSPSAMPTSALTEATFSPELNPTALSSMCYSTSAGRPTPAQRSPWGPASIDPQPDTIADTLPPQHPPLPTASRSEPLALHARSPASSSSGASTAGPPGAGPVAGRRPTVVRQSEDLRLLQRGEHISLGLSATAPDAAACAGGRLSFDTRDEDPEVLQALLRDLALTGRPRGEGGAASKAVAAVRRSLGGPRTAYVPQYCGIPERDTGSSIEEEQEDSLLRRPARDADGAADMALEAQALLGVRLDSRGRAAAPAAALAPRNKRSFEEPAAVAAAAVPPPVPPPDVSAAAAALQAAPAAVLSSALFARAPTLAAVVAPALAVPAAVDVPAAERRGSFGSDEDTTAVFAIWKVCLKLYHAA